MASSNFQSEVVPWKLWVTLGCLVAMDVVLLLVWTVVDPLHRDVKNFPNVKSNDPEDDVEIQPQLEHCKSEHHYVWLGKTFTNSFDSSLVVVVVSA